MKGQLLLIFALIINFNYSAQSVHFEFNNGTNNDYFVPYVKKMTFESNFLKLYYNNGSIFSLSVDSIDFFNFNPSSTSGIEEAESIYKKYNVFIFPNPTYDQVKMKFNEDFNEDFNVMICDLKGNVYFEKDVVKDELTSKELVIDLNNLPSNYYICTIKSNKLGSISKPLTKLR